jgi:Rhodopirellula transposase DDE domain
LDENTYQAGIRVSDEELAELAIERDAFHGEWNYRLRPREPIGHHMTCSSYFC